MAARSHDPKKFHGIGARVLRVPDAPVKFQGFRCNGFQVVGEQKSGGRRKKERKKKKIPNNTNRGPSQLGLGP